MRKILIAVCLGALLAGCTMNGVKPVFDPAVATERIDQAEQKYIAVKAVADVVLPFLPASTQAKIRAAFDKADKAFAAARIAASVAEQLAALKRATDATSEIDSLVPG